MEYEWHSMPCKPVNMNIQREIGFTLIELAVVLLIVGLLLGGLLAPLAISDEQRKRSETRQELENIRAALYGYVLINQYLPCPDNTNDGTEDRNGQSCDTNTGDNSNTGNLPWATLAVARTDGWGNPFTYAVSPNFSNVTNEFELGTESDINIENSAENGEAIALNIPAVVISHGKNFDPNSENSDDTNSQDERQNYAPSDDVPPPFVYRDFSADETNGFDDMMIWISRNTLVYRMVIIGRLSVTPNASSDIPPDTPSGPPNEP